MSQPYSPKIFRGIVRTPGGTSRSRQIRRIEDLLSHGHGVEDIGVRLRIGPDLPRWLVAHHRERGTLGEILRGEI